jgi:hypothetical protein
MSCHLLREELLRADLIAARNSFDAARETIAHNKVTKEELFDAEGEVIYCGSLLVGLLNPEEGVRGNSKNLHAGRFLLHRHPEVFLIVLL